MDLKQLRRQIDAVDRRLLRLLNHRAALALRVGRMKKSQGRPILDNRRETEILQRLRKTNDGPCSSAAVLEIFRAILRNSRRLAGSAKR